MLRPTNARQDTDGWTAVPAAVVLGTGGRRRVAGGSGRHLRMLEGFSQGACSAPCTRRWGALPPRPPKLRVDGGAVGWGEVGSPCRSNRRLACKPSTSSFLGWCGDAWPWGMWGELPSPSRFGGGVGGGGGLRGEGIVVMGNGNGIRWGLLAGMLAVADGCTRQATLDRTAAIEQAIQRCQSSSGQSSLVPVEVVAAKQLGDQWEVDLAGLWASRQPVDLVLTSTVEGGTPQPTQPPDYLSTCRVVVNASGGGRIVSDGTFNLLTQPWVGPTLTAVATTATAPTSLTPPVHVLLDSVNVLCAASPSEPSLEVVRLVDVRWSGTAWLLSFEGQLAERPTVSPESPLPPAFADRCIVTLHPSGEHEVSHRRLATSAATPFALDGRTRASDLCAGYNKHRSLIPVHLTEIYLDTTQTGTWNLVLDGLWPLFGAPAPPAYLTPIATEAPRYQRRCHLHLYPDGHEGNGGGVINVLTAPAIGPTLTAAAASLRTQPATTTTAGRLMTPTSGDRSHVSVPTWTADAGRGPEPRSR